MTFSDKRIVDLLKSDFIPAWETVAPVTVATFNLGDGRTVRGTQGGEIAIYFCRPDGKVYDVLPALQSPHVTYWAIKNALDFYRKTGATETAIREHHATEHVQMLMKGAGAMTPGVIRRKEAFHRKMQSSDGGTRALAEMSMSKTAMVSPREPMVVVEPGGLDLYKRQIHQALSSQPLRTPMEWKDEIFVRIMDQELKGGEFTYDVDTLAPISIIED